MKSILRLLLILSAVPAGVLSETFDPQLPDLHKVLDRQQEIAKTEKGNPSVLFEKNLPAGWRILQLNVQPKDWDPVRQYFIKGSIIPPEFHYFVAKNDRFPPFFIRGKYNDQYSVRDNNHFITVGFDRTDGSRYEIWASAYSLKSCNPKYIASGVADFEKCSDFELSRGPALRDNFMAMDIQKGLKFDTTASAIALFKEALNVAPPGFWYSQMDIRERFLNALRDVVDQLYAPRDKSGLTLDPGRLQVRVNLSRLDFSKKDGGAGDQSTISLAEMPIFEVVARTASNGPVEILTFGRQSVKKY